MKPGFGTVLWGRRIDDLEHTLDVIAACGFKGVEFAQHHDEIFIREAGQPGIRRPRDVRELLGLLHQRGLELIGMVGGALSERIAFLGDYKDAYLYIDRWTDDECLKALDAGFTLAVHPHWLMPIRRLQTALDLIAKFKNTPHENRVRLLLDTAHACVAEDDPVQAARDHCRDLAGVHLKSWRPDYGRWSHRYAHGFCPPDDGIVPVAEVLDSLHANGFGGWVIMEQDHYDITREETAFRCAQWLAEHGPVRGISITSNAAKVRELASCARPNPYFTALGRGESGLKAFVLNAIKDSRPIAECILPPLTGSALGGPLSELLLGRELSKRVAHRPDPAHYYDIVSRGVRQLLGAQAVKVWSYNPLLGDSGGFTLLAVDAPHLDVSGCVSIFNRQDYLEGSILSRPMVRQYDLRDQQYADAFLDRPLLAQLQESAPWLLIVPVFNTSSTEQLRFVLTSASGRPFLIPKGTGHYERSPNLERLGQLETIARVVALWSDLLTDEICSAAAGYTNHICGKSNQSVSEFIDALRDYLENNFCCNAVTILLENFSGERLEPAGKSRERLDWGGNPPFYSAGDAGSYTHRSWQCREMVFSASATSGRAREARPPNDNRDEILFAPLARWGGKCHGVVRLHNKRQVAQPLSSMFTDDDAAKLDAIIQTALPHLELLDLQERQRQSLARMVHEFQTPLVAIRGAVDLMQADIRRRGDSPSTFFRRDWLDDVLQWTELMGRLTRNARIFAGGRGGDVLRAQRTSLLAGVVMPVLRQIRPLVPDDVRFDCHQEGLDAIPPLYIDRNQMQQVFFNLLSNSIKYGRRDDLIRVRITGGPVGNTFLIFVEDWGVGIEEEEREEIFQAGYRSHNAMRTDASGQGLGLYVVRSIVSAHGGTVEVRTCRNPTTFEIALPQCLRYEPSRTAQSGER